VEHIQATSKAFAAILQDGSVIAWGDREAGGDSSSSRMWSIFRPQVKHLLQSCKMDQSFAGAIHRLVDALVIALETSNRSTFRWLPCDMGRSNVWRLGLSGCERA